MSRFIKIPDYLYETVVFDGNDSLRVFMEILRDARRTERVIMV